jgi:putative ABC transport system ATP-binding protein
MAVLELAHACRVYGAGRLAVRALEDVSLRVEAGEFVAVMGPSGSGKSTLLNVAGSLERPTSGRVLVSGADLAGCSAGELELLRRRRIGFVFQRTNLFPSLTALENVAVALELDGVRSGRALASASSLLEALGLGAVANRLPNALSGGEQQRVAIARAVVGGKSLLLADEPTGAVDSLTGEAVMNLLYQQRDTGCAVVLVTHDARHAAWADRVVFLRDGRIVEELAPPAGPETLLRPEWAQ